MLHESQWLTVKANRPSEGHVSFRLYHRTIHGLYAYETCYEASEDNPIGNPKILELIIGELIAGIERIVEGGQRMVGRQGLGSELKLTETKMEDVIRDQVYLVACISDKTHEQPYRYRIMFGRDVLYEQVPKTVVWRFYQLPPTLLSELKRRNS